VVIFEVAVFWVEMSHRAVVGYQISEVNAASIIRAKWPGWEKMSQR
jgi:hypothetical protein